jgi:hypothetical protein
MLWIVLSACLTNDANVCKDYRISVNPDFDVSTCMVDAPPYFAQWAEEHPGWQIKRWRCTTKADSDI